MTKKGGGRLFYIRERDLRGLLLAVWVNILLRTKVILLDIQELTAGHRDDGRLRDRLLSPRSFTAISGEGTRAVLTDF